MILYPLTLIISALSFALSILYLKQDFSNYFDLVAFMMVVGGTLAVGLALVPWEYRKDVVKAFLNLVRPERRKYQDVLVKCFSVLKNPFGEHSFNKEELSERLLRDGIDLLAVGFSVERIEHILREKAFQSARRTVKVGSSIKSLAKYPPAFGLIGTVLGLVNVMRGITKGDDIKVIGLEMALALVATMYGLIMANLLISPAGELMIKKAEEDEEYAEIAIETITLIAEKVGFLESQEVLNAMVPEEQKIDLLTSSKEVNEAA